MEAYYYNSQSILDVKVTSDKDTLIYLDKQKGIVKWNFQNNKLEQIDNSIKDIDYFWLTKNENQIIYASDNDGDEKLTFYLLNLNKDVHRLTEKDDSYYYFGFLDNDDENVLLIENPDNSTVFNIIKVNLSTLKSETIFKTDKVVTNIYKCNDDNNILLQVQINNIDYELEILNLDTKSTTRISSYAGRINSIYQIDGEKILVNGDNSNEYLGLHLVNTNLDHLEVFSEYLKKSFHNINIEFSRYISQRKELIFSTSVNGFNTLYIYDIENNELKDISFPKDVVIHCLDNDLCSLTAVFSGINNVTNIFIYNFDSGDSKFLYPLESDRSVNWELKKLISDDNTTLSYLIYKSQNANSPYLFYIHGGPESQEKPSYSELFRKLNLDYDYNIVLPNIRGSSGYSRSFLNSDLNEKRLTALSDLISIYKGLQITTSPKYVMGTSYGGYMTLLAITRFPELWDKAVDIVGMSSIKTFLKSTPLWRRKLRSFKYGSLDQMDSFFDSTDPINFTQNIQSDLFVIHSLNDNRVPVKESLNIIEKLNNSNILLEHHIYEDEGHFIKKVDNVFDLQEKIINFFERER